MEKCFEVFSIMTALLVTVPLLIILAGWAINVVHILWVLGEKVEAFIGKKIDAKIYYKHCQLRKEINGD